MAISLLTGDWNDITSFNYAIDPIALRPYAPIGTELDFFEDQTYLSVVALNFQRPRVLGAIPALLHSTFPMVTFRFYVRRLMRDGTYRRGTVFLKQFAPLSSVAAGAMALGKKDLVRTPVLSSVIPSSRYLYRWGRMIDSDWLEATVSGDSVPTREDSIEEFIFEKAWDFVPFSKRRTLQYHARHPRWRTWTASNHEARIDMSGIFSGDIARRLVKPPTSVFVAEGSRVQMGFPSLIKPLKAKALKQARLNLDFAR